MAKSATKAAINPDGLYRVYLARSIKVGRRPVHPGPNVKLRGDVLESVIASDPDAVKSYEPAKTIGD